MYFKNTILKHFYTHLFICLLIEIRFFYRDLDINYENNNGMISDRITFTPIKNMFLF